MDFRNRKRVLITGASGTLGFSVCRVLSNDPRYQLFIPVRKSRADLSSIAGDAEIFVLDLSNRERVRDAISRIQPHTVIHIAASGLRLPKPVWFEMTNFNVDGALRLFEACCALRECHFIYISSGLVYREQGRPLTETDPLGTLHPYGASKSAADFLLRAAAVEFGRRLTVLRPFSFTGIHDGGDRLFPSLFRAAAKGEPFALSDGTQTRDFCAVADIGRGVAQAVEYPQSELIETINLGSGRACTIRETVERVCRELSLGIELTFASRPYHPCEPKHLVADITKAKDVLGWQPCQNLAFALWELAQAEFPGLAVTKPTFGIE